MRSYFVLRELNAVASKECSPDNELSLLLYRNGVTQKPMLYVPGKQHGGPLRRNARKTRFRAYITAVATTNPAMGATIDIRVYF